MRARRTRVARARSRKRACVRARRATCGKQKHASASLFTEMRGTARAVRQR